MNSIQRQIQPLNAPICLNVHSIQRQTEPIKPRNDSTSITIKPPNRIEGQIPFRRIQPLNHQIRLKDNFIQRRIQPLNPQIGFNIKTN